MQFDLKYFDLKLREQFYDLFERNYLNPNDKQYLEFYIPSKDKIRYLVNYVKDYKVEDVNLIYKDDNPANNYDIYGGSGPGIAGIQGLQGINTTPGLRYQAGVWSPVGPNGGSISVGGGGAGGAVGNTGSIQYPKHGVSSIQGKRGGAGGAGHPGSSGSISIQGVQGTVPNKEKIFYNPLTPDEVFISPTSKYTGIYPNIYYGFKPMNIARQDELSFVVRKRIHNDILMKDAAHFHFIVSGNVKYRSNIITGLNNSDLSGIYFTMVVQFLFQLFHAFGSMAFDRSLIEPYYDSLKLQINNLI